MPRLGQLDITKDKQSGKWCVNISAKVSKTGKRGRKKFATKSEAESYRKNLESSLKSSRLKKYDEKLLETANYYHDAFQLYSFKGLDEACASWIKELDKRNHSISLGELIKRYKNARGADWSAGYIQTFEWVKKQLTPFRDTNLSQLDAQHWQSWLPVWRKDGG
jgi:hypothetical protein